jgi:hypothetical protein
VIYLRHFQDSFGRVISPSQRPLPTQDNKTQKDDKHPLTSIRTHDLIVQVSKAFHLDLAATGTGNPKVHQRTLITNRIETRLVGAPGMPIIWCPFKPAFFKYLFNIYLL